MKDDAAAAEGDEIQVDCEDRSKLKLSSTRGEPVACSIAVFDQVALINHVKVCNVIYLFFVLRYHTPIHSISSLSFSDKDLEKLNKIFAIMTKSNNKTCVTVVCLSTARLAIRTGIVSKK